MLYLLISKYQIKNKMSYKIENIPCIKLTEKDPYFELFSNCNETFGDYFYRLYNINGEIIDEQYIKRGTTINRKNDIIEVRINYGTLAIVSKYYNIRNGNESKTFQNVLISNERLCVYFEKNKLIIQDLFDNNKYYRIIDKFDSNIINSVEKLEFIENDTYLKITYMCDNETELQEILISVK